MNTSQNNIVDGDNPPSNMKEAAKDIWLRMYDELHRTVGIEPADHDLLLSYCETTALLQEISKKLNINTVVAVGGGGSTVQSALYKTYKELQTQQREISKLLGIGAQSRSAAKRKQKDTGDNQVSSGLAGFAMGED